MPNTSNSAGFRVWREDLDALLESSYSVNTTMLGVTNEDLEHCVPMALGDAVRQIGARFNLGQLNGSRPSMLRGV